MRVPRLACLGDLALDIVVRSQSPAEAGTDVDADIHFRVGGSAANTARSFARLGGRASFIGAVGDDRLGGRLIASLRADGVAVHAARVRGSSARLLVLVGASGERSFLTDRGVADALSVRALKPAWLRGVDALHVPAYSLLKSPLADAALEAAHRVRATGGLVTVDLASHRPLLAAGRRAAVELVSRPEPDVLFANSREVAALVGPGAGRESRLLAAAPIVVVKAGADGCRVLWRAGERGEVGALDVATTRVAASDTTGAGDAFDAGFLYSLIAGGHARASVGSPASLRRASLAGHRAAARVLRGPRPELVL